MSATLALRPQLATIAPNLPFLDTLAAWWLSRAGDDPVRAAEGILLVPTRRAARGLAEAFLRASVGRPLLLPRIMALGGLDEAPLTMQGALDIPPAVPPARRLAELTRLVLALRGANGAPTEADRAWVLAAELANLLDEAALAEIDLARALPGAVSESYAEHWQTTLRFLEIVTVAWPAWLADNGLADVASRQVRLLDAQERAWRDNPPTIPVIAAGTTGAIPAVGRLLRLVAHLPAGMVVLPGLDLELDEASWEALEASHPQASLRALLAAMQSTRDDVRDWPAVARPPAEICPAARIATLRTALLPAASLAQWQEAPSLQTEGLKRLEPGDQQEEAQAIALALREALQTQGARAALVTPDRQLARRVAAELLRFDIVADDSAGEPLAEVPAAVFLRLLAEAVAEDLRPVPLLALLKHPLAAAGLSPADCRREARHLERKCLRGPRPGPGLAGLRARHDDAGFLDKLAECLRPLLTLVEQHSVSPDAALHALLQSAELLAATPDASGASRLWAGEDGEALATHLVGVHEALPVLPPQGLRSLPYLLDATLAGAAVRSRRSLRGRDGAEHPRVFIWGLLEARLQTADTIVLGGLSEGTWPQVAESGPWMNRAMRLAVGLPSPEERTGLSAHDFTMAACAAPRVILSAPRRRDGAPSVPSRWLVRLDALLGTQGKLARHPAAGWARLLDRPDGPPAPVQPPAPMPDVRHRPRKLSVTDIETWLRDPYAIYAKHVLRLRKLEPLEQSADAADYGKIVHAGLHRFFERTGDRWPHDAAAQLQADMDAALEAEPMRPALAAWWRPRLRRIAVWVAEHEADRRAGIVCSARRSEIEGSWTFEAPGGLFTVHCRADRVERHGDGGIAVLDYKTGTAPAPSQVEAGLAPQLPLEAAIAQAGGFGPALQGPPRELVFWQISGGFKPGQVVSLFQRAPEKIGLVTEMARDRLAELVADFDRPGRAYLSQPSPGAAPRFTDYAHLARVAEWAAAEED